MKASPWRRAIRWGSRLDLAAWLLLVLFLGVLAGGVFPRRLLRAGLLQVIFVSAVALLALATLACTFRCWRRAWRAVRNAPERPEGLPHTASLSAPDGAPVGKVRAVLNAHGLQVSASSDSSGTLLRGCRYRLAPLGTLLTHVGALLGVSGGGLSWLQRAAELSPFTGDPGYPLVILAGVLLLAGTTLSFYFPQVWLLVWMGPDGALTLGGRAGARAWDFEQEFADIVAEIRSALETQP
ncbi:MAG: cytochrome c biogenesis protein ResB [Anaerolineae bacterium]|nr:cytochrome c biogenesis protein ResB [Anaerolineae bacterium]